MKGRETVALATRLVVMFTSRDVAKWPRGSSCRALPTGMTHRGGGRFFDEFPDESDRIQKGITVESAFLIFHLDWEWESMELVGGDSGCQLPFELLLDDPPVLVVNKQAGLLTLGGKEGVPTLERLVKETLKERFKKDGNVYLGIPHRLDRPVSGAILFTRNSKAAARMAEQFQERQVRKVYWAILGGEPAEESGTLEHW
ncbi:MAG: RNA pseudouridine synthase, partial [Planctomycetaceae bacterium]|nr:RNA pseudouridine synthase [Planctomycetaceae bacterium]